MFKSLIFTTLFSTFFLVQAQGPIARMIMARRGGDSPSLFDGKPDLPHGSDGGPLGAIMEKLSGDQKGHLKKILLESKDLAKSVVMRRIEEFIGTLGEKIKGIFLGQKLKMRQIKVENDKKASGLSGNAKNVYNQIKAVDQDESLSFPESDRKVTNIIQGEPHALQQLQSAGIQLPHKLPLHEMIGHFRRMRRNWHERVSNINTFE